MGRGPREGTKEYSTLPVSPTRSGHSAQGGGTFLRACVGATQVLGSSENSGAKHRDPGARLLGLEFQLLIAGRP